MDRWSWGLGLWLGTVQIRPTPTPQGRARPRKLQSRILLSRSWKALQSAYHADNSSRIALELVGANTAPLSATKATTGAGDQHGLSELPAVLGSRSNKFDQLFKNASFHNHSQDGVDAARPRRSHLNRAAGERVKP